MKKQSISQTAAQVCVNRIHLNELIFLKRFLMLLVACLHNVDQFFCKRKLMNKIFRFNYLCKKNNKIKGSADYVM